jgi:hypothetical protein
VEEVAMGQSLPQSRSKPGHALAIWRRCRAVQLATAGYSYDAIAREVGYANRGTAWRAVDTALRQQLVEDVELHRQVELDRLDSLYAVLWPLAKSGDMRAITAAIRNLELRSKLLGLDRAPENAMDGYSIVQPDHPTFHAKVESAHVDEADSWAS